MESSISDVSTGVERTGKKVFMPKKNFSNSGQYSNPLNEHFFRNHDISRNNFNDFRAPEDIINNRYEEDIYGEIDNSFNGASKNQVNSEFNNRVPINGIESGDNVPRNGEYNNSNSDNKTNPLAVADAKLKSTADDDNKNGLVLPSLARYKLKNKAHRHVYHDITLPHEKGRLKCDQNSGDSARLPQKRPPPLPFKPHYMRGDYMADQPPPVPPKILNRAALIQRKQLTEEYFENIRRCINNDIIDEEDGFIPGHIATPGVQLPPDPNQASTSAVSVQVPGTETNPYWTIKESPDSLLPTKSDNVSAVRPMSTSFNEKQDNRDIFLPPKPQTFPALTTSSHYQFIQSLKALKRCGWYWGNMKWEDAETMFEQRPGEEGLFLVRDSQDPLHILTLTVRSLENTIHHIRIEHTDGKFQLYEPSGGISRGAADCVRSPNIVTFIKLAMKHSKSGTFIYFVKTRNMGEPPVQIRLLTPISRFACVKTLKYYCRFAIRDAFPLEHIAQLPIPSELRAYVSKPQYFDPSEDFKCALSS